MPSNDGTATRKRLSGVLVGVQVGHHLANGCTFLTRSSIVVAARKWVAGTPWNAAGSCGCLTLRQRLERDGRAQTTRSEGDEMGRVCAYFEGVALFTKFQPILVHLGARRQRALVVAAVDRSAKVSAGGAW